MRIATRLYQQFQSLVHELAKFGVVGAIGFVMNYALTNLLRFGIDLGPLSSNVIATVATTTFAYFANRFWTFRHREQSGLGREYFLFFVFNAVGLLIQILCIGFAYYTLKLDGPVAFNAALTVGVVGGTLFRYWSYKKWVFLPPSLPPVDPHTGLPEVPSDEVPSEPTTEPAMEPAGNSAGRVANGVHPDGSVDGTPAEGSVNGAKAGTGAPAEVNGHSNTNGRRNGGRPATRAR